LTFKLFTSGSVHAEVIPCIVCLPTLMLLAEAVFPFRANCNRRLRLGFDFWPFDLMVSACRDPATDYVYRIWYW